MLDNGGYVMINLTGDNVYDQALTCLKFKGDKAILVNDGTNVFFADTLTLSGTNVIITKGGQTITISNANVVTTSGDIQPHLYRHNVKLSFTGNEYNDEIGEDKDAETSISLSGTERCDIYLIVDNTSNEEITEYNEIDQYEGLSCNVTIGLTSKQYSGTCELKPNGNIGGQDYYGVRGLLTNSSYKIASVDIDLDAIGNDLDITDTITQLF